MDIKWKWTLFCFIIFGNHGQVYLQQFSCVPDDDCRDVLILNPYLLTVPNPENCDQFYNCVETEEGSNIYEVDYEDKLQCASNYHYDISNGSINAACVFAVVCPLNCEDISTIISSTLISSSPITTTTLSPDVCINNITCESQGNFAKCTTCSENYYYCGGNGTDEIESSCGDEFLFDPNILSCVPKDYCNALGCRESVECIKIGNLPKCTDCGSEYFVCFIIGAQGTEVSCQEEWLFDANENRCVPQDYCFPLGCSSDVTCTETTNVALCNFCIAEYLFCPGANEYPIQTSCSEGFLFDPNINFCVPEDDCKDLPSTMNRSFLMRGAINP